MNSIEFDMSTAAAVGVACRVVCARGFAVGCSRVFLCCQCAIDCKGEWRGRAIIADYAQIENGAERHPIILIRDFERKTHRFSTLL